MTRAELMEIVGIAVLLGGVGAVFYGLLLIAAWAAFLGGGVLLFLLGAAVIGLANRGAE